MRIVGNPPSGGKKPTTPTIGTATDGGTGTTVSVAFTPSTYIGKSTITYTATSSPGSLTGTGSGSPITVSGLTTGTAYTFTVKGTTAYGVVSDNSAASNSVTPASPTSFESIATVTGNGSATSLTISSIPSTYKSLQIRAIAKDGASSYWSIRVNSDAAGNYTNHYIRGNGTNVAASGQTGATSVLLMGRAGLTYPGASIVDIIDYASTSKYKTLRSFWGYSSNGTDSELVFATSGLWLSTSTITSLTFINTAGVAFDTTTQFALYGIK